MRHFIKSKGDRVAFFIMSLLLGSIIGLLIATKFNISPEVCAIKTDAPAYSSAFDLETAIIKVAEQVGKSVVSISTVTTEKISAGGTRRYNFGAPDESPFFGSPYDDDFFRKFFGDFFGGLPEREFKRRGLGSGIIIDKDGFILTNEHVVRDADEITVTLSDGREFKGKVKGTDSRSDLAIVKIDAEDLTAVKMGDSNQLRIGQWVIAIGNPFGVYLQSTEPTVTTGVVSALHRSLGQSLRRESDYTDLIQTDAAINPGNSGGPLVNLKGEVIGINVAIFSTSGGYQGIGFAIPINVAKRITGQLIEGKEIVYGWLGVTVQNLDKKLSEYFNLENKNGALVASVLEDSPAQKAGIKEGDVIVKFDSYEIKDIRDLISLAGRSQVGKKVNLKIIRDGRQKTISVVLGKRPSDLEQMARERSISSYWRGMKVSEIVPQLQRFYKLPQTEGVVITDVKPGSLAQEAGFSKGDLILEIERQRVRNIKDYNKIVSEIKKNKDVLIRTESGYFILKAEE